jgi:SAM-dependent methyltransferase
VFERVARGATLDEAPMNSSPTLATWPKRPPPLTPEQQRAREAFMALWHRELPSKYGLIERFNHGFVSRLPIAEGSRTLEIGAGLGAHSKFEDLKRQDYYCLEYREEFCRELEKLFPPDRVRCGDIQQRQPWPDGHFDRVVVIHVLEHLLDLPAALDEISRLLKPSGIFDVVVPCEGSLAYSLARKVSAERLFRRNFGMDYTPIIRNEHVSTYDEIVRELDQRFESRTRAFFPIPVPISAINLVVAFRLVRRAGELI